MKPAICITLEATPDHTGVRRFWKDLLIKVK